MITPRSELRGAHLKHRGLHEITRRQWEQFDKASTFQPCLLVNALGNHISSPGLCPTPCSKQGWLKRCVDALAAHQAENWSVCVCVSVVEQD